MKVSQKIISIFGSSRPQDGDQDYRQAYDLGSLLARAGYTVCSGGYGGTMEASARGAKEAGGKTIGIFTEFFSPVANNYIDETIRTRTLVERLMKLVEIADAYVILKGGTGTLLEFAAVWEFMNKRVIDGKPILVIGNFWPPVVNTLKEELVYEGKGEATKFVTIVANLQDCVNVLNASFGEK